MKIKMKHWNDRTSESTLKKKEVGDDGADDVCYLYGVEEQADWHDNGKGDRRGS